MKRSACLLGVLLAACALLAGCACAPKAADAPPRDFKAWMGGSLGRAPWYAKVTSIEQTTRLGVPAVYIRTSLPDAERDAAAADLAARAATAVPPPISGTVYLFGARGLPVTLFIGPIPPRMEVPAAPPDAGGVAKWLKTAYGKTGEPWVARVTGSRAEERRDAVVVTTDLDFASVDDRWLGGIVLEAVRSSGMPAPRNIVVLFADGANEVSGPM